MATPKLTKPIPKVANVTRTDIERFEKLAEEARGYERLAKAKRTEQKAIGEKLVLFIDAKKTGKQRSIERSGYRLSINSVPKSVQWAKEFVKAVSAVAAEKLRKNAGTRDVLKIEKL